MKRLTSAAVAVALTALAVSAVPASSEPNETKASSGVFNSHLSQSVLFHQALAHPDQAPANLRDSVTTARQLTKTATAQRTGGSAAASIAGSGLVADLFNKDDIGLPQNEESVTACGNQ
nr:hypothetical protein [Nocardioidaceae bacterium]